MEKVYTMNSPQSRRVRLFKNSSNQAVRIPREFELPGSDAVMVKEGNRLIIEAIQPASRQKIKNTTTGRHFQTFICQEPHQC